jgi:hypothetical protein
MPIEGLIAERDGDTTTIIGFTGSNLGCEGCGGKTDTLTETEDGVLLCDACIEICGEE